MSAQPSAVTGYNDTYADLLHNVSGNYQYLADSAGLVQVTDFYSTTTATSSSAGGVAGYYQDTKLQQGETGTAILQNSTQYISHTSSGITVYPVANTTQYRNTDGTGGETTSYSYTWNGSNQIQSITTSLPVVSSVQNGPNTADVSVVYLDTGSRGRFTKVIP